MSVIGSKGLDRVHHLIDFLHLQPTLGSRDVDQHATGARQIDAFQQRRRDGLLGSNARTVDTSSSSRAHHGAAHFTHDCADVFEVDVDQARVGNDFGDTTHSVFQHVVGGAETIVHIGVVTHDFHQLVVEDDDQRIDMLGKLGDAGFCGLHPLATFKTERLGDHANGQDAHFAGDFGNHRCSAGTRTTTHAGGNEGHVGAFQTGANFVAMGLSGFLTFFRLGTCTKAGLA